MRFKEILGRVTGLSSPVLGISWNPPEQQIQAARRIVAFLEDRRVLFVASEMEVPTHCIHSVIEMRRFFTAELQSLDADTELARSLRAMRSACHKFMSTVGDRPEIASYGASQGHWANWVFNGAVGELRGVIGIHVARLAAAHGLDVEDGLASIFPLGSDPEQLG